MGKISQTYLNLKICLLEEQSIPILINILFTQSNHVTPLSRLTVPLIHQRESFARKGSQLLDSRAAFHARQTRE